ncbi:hypothetical protein GYMLUDRAFT_915022 [Collybiopsis luxurians FD-317 M1]|nr:hypothetical protein GYMLUDRAFT_915022 [Collybiopsis luxurians FD-317 M1]
MNSPISIVNAFFWGLAFLMMLLPPSVITSIQSSVCRVPSSSVFRTICIPIDRSSISPPLPQDDVHSLWPLTLLNSAVFPSTSSLPRSTSMLSPSPLSLSTSRRLDEGGGTEEGSQDPCSMARAIRQARVKAESGMMMVVQQPWYIRREQSQR